MVTDGNDTLQQPSREPPLSADAACRHAVAALALGLELHDYRRGRFAETRRHGESVTALALRFVDWLGLDLGEDPQLEWGCRLHDIGMLGVSPAILAYAGPLGAEQLDEVREHPWLGERIVASVPYLSGVARQVIGSHHEKWDGSGYPRGLSGEDIPLAARIFALVDAFDVMTNDQLYREALPVELALAEIQAKVGTHFDPALAPRFLRMLKDLKLPLHRANVSAVNGPTPADRADAIGEQAAQS